MRISVLNVKMIRIQFQIVFLDSVNVNQVLEKISRKIIVKNAIFIIKNVILHVPIKLNLTNLCISVKNSLFKLLIMWVLFGCALLWLCFWLLFLHVFFQDYGLERLKFKIRFRITKKFLLIYINEIYKNLICI